MRSAERWNHGPRPRLNRRTTSAVRVARKRPTSRQGDHAARAYQYGTGTPGRLHTCLLAAGVWSAWFPSRCPSTPGDDAHESQPLSDTAGITSPVSVALASLDDSQATPRFLSRPRWVRRKCDDEANESVSQPGAGCRYVLESLSRSSGSVKVGTHRAVVCTVRFREAERGGPRICSGSLCCFEGTH